MAEMDSQLDISYIHALCVLGQLAYERHATITSELVPLDNCCGRVIAEDIFSPVDLLARDNSAMDGYALCSQWTQTASSSTPVNLLILNDTKIAAGDYPPTDLSKKNVAVTIMTGGWMPDGYDVVIPFEKATIIPHSGDLISNSGSTDVDVQASMMLHITTPIMPFSNCRRRGEDVQIGYKIARKGQLIVDPGLIVLLSATGLHSIPVYRKIFIGLITTGKEVENENFEFMDDGFMKIEQSSDCWRIPNSNRAYITALFNNTYSLFNFKYFGHCSDDLEDFRQKLLVASNGDSFFDVVISTGGVSKGDYDYVPFVLRDLQAKFQFQGVKMKPGHPVLCATLSSGGVFFGLPGNPVAAAACVSALVLEFVALLLCTGYNLPLYLERNKDNTTICKKDFVRFERGNLMLRNFKLKFVRHDKQGSAILCSLAESLHWRQSRSESSRFTLVHNPFQHKFIAPTIIRGIVLCGGYSTRMGTTKALILDQNNHIPVMVHIANLLRPLVESVHISVRSDQDDVIELCKKENLSMLCDETPGLCGGPAAGMLAAKNFDSQCTWIVVACDYYNLEFSTFINLLACHEPGITCFRSAKDEYHDPLLAVWDADDLVTLEESVKAGRSGPCYTIRLLSSMNRLTIVDPIDRRWVQSANTAEEWENVAKIQTI